MLEFSYPPGGARLAEVYAYSRIELIRSCLEQRFLRADLEPFLLPLMIRGTLALWTVQRGSLCAGLDLRAFMTLLHGGQRAALGDPSVESICHAVLLDRVPRPVVTMKWDEIKAAAPALDEPLARPGCQIGVSRGPRWAGHRYVGARAMMLDYGFTDLEHGANAPPCDFEDPDSIDSTPTTPGRR